MFDTMEPPGTGTEDTPPRVSVAELETLRARLAALSPDDLSGGGLSNGELVGLVQAAEAVKNALAGVQAVLAVGLDGATRAKHAAAGMPTRRQGTGVISELGLARRESFTQARRHLDLATILATEMPHTLAALRAGVLSEWRATTIVRETACLTLAHRQTVDIELCAGPDWEPDGVHDGELGGGAGRLNDWGDKQLAEERPRRSPTASTRTPSPRGQRKQPTNDTCHSVPHRTPW